MIKPLEFTSYNRWLEAKLNFQFDGEMDDETLGFNMGVA